jgi:AraC-like DNA-binding protein
MATQDEPPLLRFSTDDLPSRDRLAIWREVIGKTVARLDLEPIGDGPFRSECVTRTLPDLALSSISLTAIRSQRTRELLADGNDDIEFVFIDSGRCDASQLGRHVEVDAGVALLVSNADESTVTSSAATGHSIRIPRRAILPLVGQLEDRFMRAIPRENEAVRLLTSYAAMLEQMPLPATPELRHLIVSHIHDLVAVAVGATRDAGEMASRRGMRAARLAAIKADIAKNISRHELSTEWMASRHRMSPSSVRRLFEEDGTTFSHFVLDYRLAHAHRLICDPRFADRTISSIAYAIGFGDLSYFNRMFRKRFGASPSDIRQAARREADG